jgi:hypothetical protein
VFLRCFAHGVPTLPRKNVLANAKTRKNDSAEKPPSFERTTKNNQNESSRETSMID